MGEHGDSTDCSIIPCVCRGKPFAKLQKEYPDTLGKITIEDLQDEVRQAGMTVIIGKKSTEFGIGIALSEIVKSIVYDEKKDLAAFCPSGWGVWTERRGSRSSGRDRSRRE